MLQKWCTLHREREKEIKRKKERKKYLDHLYF